MAVTLRSKPISKGRERLYLDFYPAIPNPDTGKATRREFLDLYIYSNTLYQEQTFVDTKGISQKRYVQQCNSKGEPRQVKLDQLQKEHNKTTLLLAENIKAQRQLLVQADNYGFLKKDKGNTDFLAFAKELADKHKATKRGDKNNWVSCYKHLLAFTNGRCEAKDITESFCQNFKEYLLQAKALSGRKEGVSDGKGILKNNSAVGYFNIFKRIVKLSVKGRIIENNVVDEVSAIKRDETKREYLTFEELQMLAKTECDLPYLKHASLFSALTGLRYGDIEKLVWDEIEGNEKTGYQIRFAQEKTKGQETMPISNEAFSLLGKRSAGKVFPKLLYSAWQNMKIQEWLYKAGVYKKISFHGFRHTYATLQLKLGTDLYTVSKMLGHRNITTTQIYAKIVDETKRDAANRIKLGLN